MFALAMPGQAKFWTTSRLDNPELTSCMENCDYFVSNQHCASCALKRKQYHTNLLKICSHQLQYLPEWSAEQEVGGPDPAILEGGIRDTIEPHYCTAYSVSLDKVHHLRNFVKVHDLVDTTSSFSFQPCAIMPYTHCTVFYWWIDTKHLLWQIYWTVCLQQGRPLMVACAGKLWNLRISK